MSARSVDMRAEAAAWLADHPGLVDGPAHARLGPSAAEAWMTCAGYPNAVDGLADSSSEYAAEGTAAHSVSDDCLAFGLDAYDFIGSRLTIRERNDPALAWTFEWTEADAHDLQPGLDEIRAFEGQFFGEQKVDLSDVMGVERQFGTLDRGVVGQKLIVIGDLKWGRGIPVSPVRNKQLMLYGLGFWRNIARYATAATDFLFIIDQPRCPGGGGHWRCTLDELLAFEQEVRVAALRTLDPAAPRTASEKGCYWCARRKQPPTEPGAVSGCKTYDEFALDLIGSKFDAIDEAAETGEGFAPPRLDRLSAERRSWIVRHKGAIEKWLEQLHAQVIHDALSGDPTPGLKLVDGRRGRKAWADEREAEAWLEPRLGENMFTKKLTSPAQALKKLPVEERRALADSGLIREGVAKPALVDEADDRPARATVDDKFAKIEADEEGLL